MPCYWPTVFPSFRHIHDPNQRPWCAWVCAVKELAPTIDDASPTAKISNKYKYLNTTRDLFPRFQVMALCDHDKQQEVENTNAIATLCFLSTQIVSDDSLLCESDRNNIVEIDFQNKVHTHRSKISHKCRLRRYARHCWAPQSLKSIGSCHSTHPLTFSSIYMFAKFAIKSNELSFRNTRLLRTTHT